MRQIELERLQQVPEGTRLVPEAERQQILAELFDVRDEIKYTITRFPGSLSDIK